MNELEKALYSLIEKGVNEKTSKGKEPAHITYIEINNEIKKALNNLCREGVILHGTTLNSIYFKTKKEKK